MIAVTPDSYTPAEDAVIALEGMKPSYGDETMRINYRQAMRKMLQPLSSEERQLVVDKLNSSAYQPVQNLEIRQNLASDDITSLREETWLDGMPKEECMARALDGSVKRMEREYMQQSADKAQSYVAVSPQGEAIKKTMTAEAFCRKRKQCGTNVKQIKCLRRKGEILFLNLFKRLETIFPITGKKNFI